MVVTIPLNVINDDAGDNNVISINNIDIDDDEEEDKKKIKFQFFYIGLQ